MSFIFEMQKYMDYIHKLENSITWSYVIIMIIAVLIGLATGGVGLILTIPLGLLIAGAYTLNTKIRVQEMKYKCDMYNMVQNKSV